MPHKDLYKQILDNSAIGYACHKILCDEKGRPSQFEYVEINRPFEAITGLKSADLIGQPVSNDLPWIEKSDFDWTACYRDVASTGVVKQFEQFSEPLNKWYRVNISAPENGYLLTTLIDITHEQEKPYDLKDISNLSKSFMSQAGTVMDNMFQSIQDGFSFMDADLTIRNMNQVMQDLMGVSESCIGKKCYEAYHNRRQPCEKCPTIKALEVKKACSGILPLMIKNQQKGWLEVFSYPLIDQSTGEPEGVVELVRDITERKRTEDELRIKSHVLDQIQDRVTVTDLDGMITYANFAEKKALGYSGEALAAASVQMFGDDYITREEVLAQTLQHGKWRGELVHTTARGSEVMLDTRTQVVLDEHGKRIALAGISTNITEQKIMEEKLKESEFRLNVATKGTHTGIWDWDMVEDNILYSSQWKEMLGYKDFEVENTFEGWKNLWHPEEVTEIEKAIEDYLSGKSEKYEIIHRCRHKDGNWRWIITRGELLSDLGNSPYRWIGTSIDITAIKQAEEKLKEYSSLLEKLPEQVPGVIYQYRYHPDGRNYFPYAASTIWDIYQVTPEEVKEDAAAAWSRFHPDDAARVTKGIVESSKTLQIWKDEYRVILPGRGERWLSGVARPRRLEDDSVLWHGYINDVTDKKHMEHQLFKEKEQFKTTLLSVGDGVISTDAKGHVIILNPVAEQLTGWTQAEAAGRPIEDILNIIHEFTRIRCENPVKKVLETGCVIEQANHTMLISRDGVERPVEDSAAPIRDEKGHITGVVLVFRDFTEKKKSQDEIQYLSFHDHLTGLYNRRFFETELHRLDAKRNLPITIVMSDVNGLKLINDSFGHSAGDELLMKAAETVKKGCRSDDIIARVGGDEIAVLMPNTDSSEAEAFIKRMKGLIKKQKVRDLDISVSFGYDTKTDETESVDVVLKKAEDYMYNNKLFEGQGARKKVIDNIIAAINGKSPREKAHSERVSVLCAAIGKALKLEEREIQKFKVFGLLHDIGKIAIADNILNKPGKLTPEELNEMRRHAEIGYRILSTANDMSEIAEYVLSHHERWDGKGYPKRLKEKNIPLLSRICAIADAYDAMTSERSYRPAMPKSFAVGELRKHAGTQFDPELVQIFIDRVLISEKSFVS